METPVVFHSADFQLIGILHQPDSGSAIPASHSAIHAPDPGFHLPTSDLSSPAILMLHGFTGQKSEAHRLFVKTARALAQAGFLVLRFDFRGSGDSGGEFEHVTVSGWQADAQVALDFLLNQPGVDKNRVGVIGLSTGGAVACHLVSQNPSLRSAALWSAVADGASVMATMGTPEQNDHLQQYGWVDRQGNKVCATFLEEFTAMRPADDLTQAHCAVLIVHGTADDTVPVVQADTFEKAALNTPDRRVEKLIVPFANHTYANLALEAEVIDATVTWFQETL